MFSRRFTRTTSSTHFLEVWPNNLQSRAQKGYEMKISIVRSFYIRMQRETRVLRKLPWSIRGLFVLLCVPAVLMGARPAVAQTGVIQGTVTDSTGAVIPNASVTATDTGKGVLARDTTTNGSGNFQLQPLSTGIYLIEIKAPGFSTLQRENINLDISQTLNLGNLLLAPGSDATVVTVDSTPDLIETTTSEHSDVITAKEVTETSLNGRDFQSLIRTLPGVVSNDTSDFRLAFNNTDSFHVNGLRGSANNVYLDGSINTDVGANDGQYTQLSLDATGEFKLLTGNYNAEYGRSPGVQILINTKAGGRQFHGTAYEFNREDGFDANKYELNHTGSPRAKLRFNQFGGNISGPILIPKLSSGDHKKLFFFYNYEGTRATQPRNTPNNGQAYYDIPAAPQLTGDFSGLLQPSFITYTDASGNKATSPYHNGQLFVPGTIVRDSGGNPYSGTPIAGNIIAGGLSRQAPAWAKLLGRAYSLGVNTPVNAATTRVSFQDTYQFKKDQHVVRIDFNPNDKTSTFFRWVNDSQRESQQFGIFSYDAFPILPQYREKPGASWSFNINNVISPTLTNEAIFTYNHLTQRVDVNTAKANYDQTALGFDYQQLYPGTNLRSKYPGFNAGGFFAFDFPPGWHSEGRTLGFTDNIVKTLGAHTVKTGGFVNIVRSGQQPSFTEAPFFDFSSGSQNVNDAGNPVANLLFGNYANVSQTNGIFYGAFEFHQWEIFGQDTWRVNHRLTLDYGLRYAYLGPTYTYGKFLQNYFDPSRYNPSNAAVIQTASGLTQGSIIGGDPFNGIVQEGTNGIPAGFAKHRYNNFQPRVGFAMDVFGDGRTAFRGGAGIFNERIRQNNDSFDGLGNPPLSYTPQLYNGNIDTLSPALIAGGTRFPVGINAFDKAGQVPTYYGYNLGLQQQLGYKVVLGMTYVGNTARHLQYTFNLNTLPVGTTTAQSFSNTGRQVPNSVVPYKGYSSINYTKYDASSNYNGLQVVLTRRFSKSFTLTGDYTFSRSIDLTDDDNNTNEILDIYNPKRDRAVAGFDRTNVFNVNYIYTAPEFRNRNFLVRSAIGGWEITGITRAWSGTPFTVVSNGNAGNLSGSGVRADYTPQGGLYSKRYTQYFNPLLFSRPLDGSLGNTSRNQFRGPGFQNWDISLFKNFIFNESTRVQLRLETFNTFNHTQFAGVNGGINAPNPGDSPTTGPNGTLGSSGSVNSVRNPRNVQIGGKFYF